MPFIQIKNFFLVFILVNEVFSVLGADSGSESNLDTFRDMGKIVQKYSCSSELEIQASQPDCLFGPGN